MLIATIAARTSPLDIDGIPAIGREPKRFGWRINSKGHAAAVLGLEPTTLRSRMQKLGIRRPASPRAPYR